MGRSGLCRLCPGALAPACVAHRCPRSGAGSLPAGAAHRQRSAADTSGRSGSRPGPTATGPPADSPRPAVVGGSAGAPGQRRARVVSACARRRTEGHRGEGGRCARRPAAPCARRGNIGATPRRCAGQEGVERAEPTGARLRDRPVGSWEPGPGAAGLPACGGEGGAWSSACSCGVCSLCKGRHHRKREGNAWGGKSEKPGGTSGE
jgi:hypothetical protein